MPYDSAKTRQMLTIVGAFANHPGGEFIADLAKQLTDAEGEITEAVRLKVKAEGEANRYASELATMQATIRQLREENETLKQPAAPTAAKIKRAPRPVVPPEPAAPATPPVTPPPAAPAPAAESPKRPRRQKAAPPA
jgi:hypothetical protein